MSTRRRSPKHSLLKSVASRTAKYPVSSSGFRPPYQNPSAPVPPGTKTRDEGDTEQQQQQQQRGLSLPDRIIAPASSHSSEQQQVEAFAPQKSLTWMESEEQGDTQQYPVVIHSYNSIGLAGKVSQSLFGEDKRVDSLRRALRS